MPAEDKTQFEARGKKASARTVIIFTALLSESKSNLLGYFPAKFLLFI